MHKATVVAKADEVLAQDLQTGNADALTVLFERYSGVVFAIAYAVLRDHAEAEEVVQQVFLEVYETIRQFDYAKGAFRPWLLKKAEFRAIDQHRRLKAQGIYKWVSIDDQEDLDAISEAVFRLSREEIPYFVGALLRVLSPRQLRVIKLAFFKGLTLQEVGTETNETPSAVRRLFYGGLRKLRASIVSNGKNSATPGKEAATKEKLDVSA